MLEKTKTGAYLFEEVAAKPYRDPYNKFLWVVLLFLRHIPNLPDEMAGIAHVQHVVGEDADEVVRKAVRQMQTELFAYRTKSKKAGVVNGICA